MCFHSVRVFGRRRQTNTAAKADCGGYIPVILVRKSLTRHLHVNDFLVLLVINGCDTAVVGKATCYKKKISRQFLLARFQTALLVCRQ